MRYLYLVCVLVVCGSVHGWCQDDSTKTERVDGSPVTQPSNVQIPDSAFDNMGVAVSPSSMHLNIKPGTTVTKEVKVSNATKGTFKFQVSFMDFEMGINGKPTATKPDENKYGLSKWMNASPSYFELKPGEELKLKLTIAIPDGDDAYKSAWTIVVIDQVRERPPLDAGDKPGQLSLGIIPSFGFGVYIYQSPPNVKINSVAIQKFVVSSPSDGKKRLDLSVKNTGDGITYATSYCEVTNLQTGFQQKLQVKRFTILPQYEREFNYELPTDLPKGKYSAVGVVDYGNSEEIVAAEVEFEN